MPTPTDDALVDLCRRFRVPELIAVTPLGNHGGFSGAALWHVATAAGAFYLRGWPPTESADRLAWLHRLMTTAAHTLPFVPRLVAAEDGATALRHDGRLWELQSALPGVAALEHRPEPTHLAAACRALGQLHRVWAQGPPARGPIPAVRRRLALLADVLTPTGLGPELGDAAELVARHAPRMTALLAPWRNRERPLHPCLCDVWARHVLFEGERVSGIVDYGSVKGDFLAVDLARLVGDVAGDDETLWRVALDAYAAERPLMHDGAALARVLDRTGVVAALANWVRWLGPGGRTFDDPTAAFARLQRLARRVRAW